MSVAGQHLGFQAGLREDFAILHEEGCEGAVLEQFEENLRRMALGQPSLQAELAPETLPDPTTQVDFKTACDTYINEYGFSVGREWCPCLAGVFGAKMTIGQIWTELFDDRSFFRRVDVVPDGGPADPNWRYYEPANACRGEE